MHVQQTFPVKHRGVPVLDACPAPVRRPPVLASDDYDSCRVLLGLLTGVVLSAFAWAGLWSCVRGWL